MATVAITQDVLRTLTYNALVADSGGLLATFVATLAIPYSGRTLAVRDAEVNGHNCVRFNGSSDRMMGSGLGLTGSAALTVFVISKNSAAGFKCMAEFGGYDGNRGQYKDYAFDIYGGTYLGNINNDRYWSGNWAANTWQIGVARWSGANISASNPNVFVTKPLRSPPTGIPHAPTESRWTYCPRARRHPCCPPSSQVLTPPPSVATGMAPPAYGRSPTYEPA